MSVEDDPKEEPPPYESLEMIPTQPILQQIGPTRYERNFCAFFSVGFLMGFNCAMKFILTIAVGCINIELYNNDSERPSRWWLVVNCVSIINVWQSIFWDHEPFRDISRNKGGECPYGYFFFFADIVFIAIYPIFCYQGHTRPNLAIIDALIAVGAGIFFIIFDLFSLWILRNYECYVHDPCVESPKFMLSHRTGSPFSGRVLIIESGPFRITLRNISYDGVLLEGSLLVERIIEWESRGNKGQIIKEKQEVKIRVDLDSKKILPGEYLYLIPSNHTLLVPGVHQCTTFRSFGREKGLKVTTTIYQINESGIDNKVTLVQMEEVFIPTRQIVQLAK